MGAILGLPFVEQFREPDTPFLSPARVGEFLGFKVQELAERAHVHRNSGERTGEPPTMLDRAANVLSIELERRAMTMAAVLEPLMILVMGGIVLVIVLAVMMPIIEINQLVQ